MWLDAKNIHQHTQVSEYDSLGEEEKETSSGGFPCLGTRGKVKGILFLFFRWKGTPHVLEVN